MTNIILKKLSLADLVDLLIKGTQELFDMGHMDAEAYADKKKQVQLVQQAIVAKTA